MDASRILPNLFVGPCPKDPADIDQLGQALGVTAVLNLQTQQDFDYWSIDWDQLEAAYRAAGIDVRRVPIEDFNPDDLRHRLPGGVAALDALLKAGHTTYVHCSAGINRAPSTVIAYLHWVEGWELDRAVAHVTERRACDPYVEAIRLASEDWGRDAET